MTTSHMFNIIQKQQHSHSTQPYTTQRIPRTAALLNALIVGLPQPTASQFSPKSATIATLTGNIPITVPQSQTSADTVPSWNNRRASREAGLQQTQETVVCGNWKTYWYQRWHSHSHCPVITNKWGCQGFKHKLSALALIPAEHSSMSTINPFEK